MAMRIKWADAEEVTMINIYAPNDRSQHPAFWAQLDLERHQKHVPKPDFVLRDFNITEDTIDQLPPKENENIKTKVLREIRMAWGIQDQWRHNNPAGRVFIHSHTNGGRQDYARLDRIYSAHKHANNLFEWKSRPGAVPTDHWLVSVKFAPKDAPTIGQGRWTCPTKALQDDPLIRKLIAKGIKAQTKIEKLTYTPLEQHTSSPQVVWDTFKGTLQKTIKKDYKDKQKLIKDQRENMHA